VQAATALVLTTLRNNNRSLSDKSVTGATCHAGFHGATHPPISQTAVSKTHDR